MTEHLSVFGKLPLELAENIREINPWWVGKPGVALPSYRRWVYEKLKRLFTVGITKAVVLRGPRRVGKTILLKQLIDDLISNGMDAKRILYVPFDELPTLRGLKEPVLDISRWFEEQILGSHFNEASRAGQNAFLFIDEVQNLDSWAPQVKNLVDNNDVRVIITGSSSLRIEAGRDSLAGCITPIDLGPLLLREIYDLRNSTVTTPYWPDNGPEHVTEKGFWIKAVEYGLQTADARDTAYRAFSERGAYPVAHERKEIPFTEMADHLNETIIKRAIQHDLRMGPRGQKRDERLLEEVFRLCCRYAGQTPGQAVFVSEIQQALAGNIGWKRILSYMKFLDGAMLLRLVDPLELRLKKRKSPPKICLCDHALRAAWLQEMIPLHPDELKKSPHLSDLAGCIAESILGYFLETIPNLDIAHFPERGSEPEVDFILTVGTRRIPIEVKYRHQIDPFDDTRGLRSFLEKSVYNAPLGLLVTLEDGVQVNDPRIIPISLSNLLWLR